MPVTAVSLRILLVEDLADCPVMTAAVLGQLGHTVRVGTTARKVLPLSARAARRNSPLTRSWWAIS